MQAQETDLDLAVNDLGPLAWVLDELRKSLDSASAALRRFVRDAGLARGTDMASVDTGQLRIARQQLHQAVGALEMVGLVPPAHVLRSMESAVQKFVERPELCSEAGAAKVERAGFALAEYLEGVLMGKPLSAVALFPQYKDVQELAGADRVHPADLWALEWKWTEPETPAPAETLGYSPAVRARMDQAVLRIVKSAEAAAGRELSEICAALAAGQQARQPRVFWKVCAGFFEAVGLGLLPGDLFVKRAGSRVLVQYAQLAKGELGVSDRLAQDLVFFCAQAVPARPTDAPLLAGVRRAWGLERFKPVDYATAQFGRFDPVLLAQARKRIGIAKETWSALSGGDANKLKGLAEQFHGVTDSLLKLHAPSQPLAQALGSAADSVVRAAQPPRPELAMEVATAVLYLEAAFQDLDPTDAQLSVRTGRLAERLDRVRQGGQPEPLEPWMEELYRRVSDRQTMGSVVGELRGTLSELEKDLDAFFRNPQDKKPLGAAPGRLAQMRGVLSLLGLDQASQAVLRMRDMVEEIIVTEIDEAKARSAGTFDKLGNNLGALGFLIDMLNYQPSLAKKLFVYDDVLGELKPLMGRTAEPAVPPAPEAHAATVAFQAEATQPMPRVESTVAFQPEATQPFVRSAEPSATGAFQATVPLRREAAPAPAPATASAPAVPPAPAPATAAQPVPTASADEDDGQGELLDIFLEEAREVVQNGQAALRALAGNPGDVGELTTLRRAFHTLKGSSRMVGLTEFGEAGWSLEQVLNAWLADQKPASEDLRGLAQEALEGFGRWVEDIATQQDGAWKAAMFRGPADSFRTEQRRMPFAFPVAGGAPVAEAASPALPPVPEPTVILRPESLADPAPLATPEPVAQPLPAMDFSLDAFELPAAESPVAASPAVEPAAVAAMPALEALPQPAAGLEDSPVPAPEPLAFEPVASEPVAFELGDFDLPAEAAAVAQPETEPAVQPEVAPDLELNATQILRGEAATPAEVPLADLDQFDFSGAPAEPLPAEPVPQIEGIDFASLAAVSNAVPASEPPAAPAAEAFDVVELSGDSPEAMAFDLPAPAPTPAEPPADEQVKVIGSLRIGIPLYNVYLNEADEWSRRLATEISEWALELDKPVPDSAVALAHSLAGSSATVGFQALSDIARMLEHSLQKAQRFPQGTPQHGAAYIDAAEEIRRLLHQFAAGFLKEPDDAVLRGLQAVDLLEPPASDSTLSGIAARFGTMPELTAAQPVLAPAEPEPVEAPIPQAHVPSDTAQPQPATQPPQHAPAQPVTAFADIAASAPRVPQTVRVAIDVDDEDQIDVVDAVDLDLFPIFEEEAVELMPQLGGALRQWNARPDNRSARDEVLRGLHTLKGSARLAGALRLGEMAHRMETAVEQLGTEQVNAVDIEPLLQRFDNMQARFDLMRTHGGIVPASEEFGAAMQAEVTAPAAADVPPPPEQTAPAVPAEPTAAPSAMPAAAAMPQAAPTRAVLAMPVATSVAAQRQAANQAVRVRSQLLDRLVNQAGEVMITRSRLEAELRQLRSSLNDLTGNLDRLRSQLRDIELQAESQMQSRLAQAKDSAANFDPLEFDRFTRVQELTRMMAESVNDVATVQRNLQRTVEATEDDLIAQARQTRELQRDLLRTRMVEFESISDRLYRVVRLASKETGKQVKLDITGGSIEMDRGVLDRMTAAFEHLLRNCVAHGIEEPGVRLAAGKDAAGTILIGLHQEGNDVSVEFQDDGAGLNLPRIREKALQQGLITPEQELTDQDAANLIFMPGFSTAQQVTELAGRGIGMDVVRAEVNALGGRIETSTRPGQGTSFKLVLPLTTAVTQVVMVRSGKLAVGVPANVIELVRRVSAKDIQQAYNSGVYEHEGEQVPFFWSGALLQASQRSAEPQGKTLPVVIFRSAAQRVAVHVDEVLGNQEVVVKNLGPQLARLPGLAGMTVLASGAVVLIYNPVALAAVYGQQARQLSADHAQPDVLEQTAAAAGASVPAVPVVDAPPQIPLVLVVDDSITVRRVTQRLLQREGYRVSLAADGLQALERLAEERPAVVLSDIEMPRMDGFDLARNIRADARLASLPIVMITSRIAEKHREHAASLGVNHYLGKPYSEEELLSLVKHYCSQGIPA